MFGHFYLSIFNYQFVYSVYRWTYAFNDTSKNNHNQREIVFMAQDNKLFFDIILSEMNYSNNFDINLMKNDEN